MGVSAGLSPNGLASNGGSTQTIGLVAGSPAFNTGSTAITGLTVPGVDQRGVVRNPTGLNNGATDDIGSFETSSSYIVTTTADNTGNGTLRAAVAWADTNPSSALSGPNTIIFDPSVFTSTTPQTIMLSPSLGTLSLSNTQAGILFEGPGASILTISGGGALELFSITSGASVTFENVTLSSGAASSGGAIMNLGNLTLTSDTLSGNSANYYGGAVYNNGGTLTVNGSTFSGNSALYGLGGAIDNSGTATISSSTFTGGAAYQGGAIDNKGGTLSITNSILNNNSGTLGGAVFNNANATIIGSTIANDNTSFDGGGIANDLNGTLMIVNSTIAFNHAGQTGGGINQVGGGSGGGGGLTVISSTIAYNTINAGGAGGGIDASSGSAQIFDSIVALNTSGGGTTASASDIAGSVALNSANNLIGGGGSGRLVNGTNGNKVGVPNINLATSLANNGGPTPTIAVLAGSAAIGGGSSSITGITVPTVDQRGTARPGNSITIGAYQYTGPTTVTTTASAVATPAVSAPTASTAVVSSFVSIKKEKKKTIGAHGTVPGGGSATKFHHAKKKTDVKHTAVKHTALVAKPSTTQKHASMLKHATTSIKKKSL